MNLFKCILCEAVAEVISNGNTLCLNCKRNLEDTKNADDIVNTKKKSKHKKK